MTDNEINNIDHEREYEDNEDIGSEDIGGQDVGGRKVSEITQELFDLGEREYRVEITTENGEIHEFYYDDSNAIFPLYNSLINTIRRHFSDCHIELTTDLSQFAAEVNGTPNKNTRMLEILRQTQETHGVSINATADESMSHVR